MGNAERLRIPDRGDALARTPARDARQMQDSSREMLKSGYRGFSSLKHITSAWRNHTVSRWSGGRSARRNAGRAEC